MVSGFPVVSVWGVTTASTVANVLTASMDCKVPKLENACVGSVDAYVPYAR